MNYQAAKEAVKREFARADGYSGNITHVGLAFIDGIAVEVAKCGCYRANGRKYDSEAEMLYYFDNHQNVHFPQVLSNFS